jgi:hypothetical protein
MGQEGASCIPKDLIFSIRARTAIQRLYAFFDFFPELDTEIRNTGRFGYVVFNSR